MSARYHPKFCRECGHHESEVGRISARHKCATCGDERLTANNRGIAAHAGPFFDNWRRAMAACVGAHLLDDQREEA